MEITERERKAYEDDKKEKQFISDYPMSFMLSGGIKSRPTEDKEAAAYDKGLRGKQLKGYKK